MSATDLPAPPWQRAATAAPVASGALARLPGLDLLRGIAILAVILNHTGQGFDAGYTWVAGAATMGTYGVQLFFLVSALTMCHLWSLRETEPNRITRFYVRRLCRIAPLFWLAVPTYLLVFGLGQRYQAPQGIQWHQVLTTLTFLHGFWPDTMNSVVPGGWSIAVEMSFYAVFPWIALRLKDRRGRLLAAAIGLWLLNACVLRGWIDSALHARFADVSPQLLGDFLYLNALNQAPVFLLGCYLYHAIARAPTRGEWLALAGWVATAWAARHVQGIEGFGFLLICTTLALIAGTAMRLQLRFPLIEALGRHSYAMYLTHFMVLHAVGHLVPRQVGLAAFVALMAATTLAAYGLARLAYRLVERPVQRWVESFIPPLPPSSGR